MIASRNKLATSLLAVCVALTGALIFEPAKAAEDAFVCMEETQEKCDYQNRNLELFMQGRDACPQTRQRI